MSCVNTRGSEQTFSELTFSKVFRTLYIRVSICDVSRELAAEKAARCGIRPVRSLENEEGVAWREVTLRKARRRNDMRDSLQRDRVRHLLRQTHLAEVIYSPLISENAEKELYSLCYGGCHGAHGRSPGNTTTRAISGEPQLFNSPLSLFRRLASSHF